MKMFLLAFAALFAFSSVAKAEAIGGQEFTKVIYLAHTSASPSPSASNDGRDYNSAKILQDANLFAIPKNVVITNVYVIVDSAVAGLTAFNIGDTDSANGYIVSAGPTSGFNNLGNTGLHYWDLIYKGSYLLSSNVVSNHEVSKYYSAAGKYLTLDVTGVATSGKMRVFLKGYSVGASGL